jgi:hypothetical protein
MYNRGAEHDETLMSALGIEGQEMRNIDVRIAELCAETRTAPQLYCNVAADIQHLSGKNKA